MNLNFFRELFSNSGRRSNNENRTGHSSSEVYKGENKDFLAHFNQIIVERILSIIYIY